MSTSNIFLPASLGAFAGILLGTIAGIDIVSTLILAAACAVLGVAVGSNFEDENPTLEDYEN
ncbi:hypothetical protein GLW36_12030 [Halorubrum terrestre]|jgi:hypothetical protein|uniref:Uncharacterized protein n=1 Tax=Halorubrum distributum TaxID=29283 RepID=A0A6B1IG72_9EURY|nr:hypothetical protein [Halorubrum terrestre]MYL17366.1 hypothetical protein [Halorubrum terrestre]